MLSFSSSSFSLPLFLSLISSLCFLSHGATNDTLNPGQSISTIDGSTLVSEQGVFELGFFSPENSSNRYVAIWYHGISPIATIWIGNRENPIPPSSSAYFTHSISGNLELVAGSANGNVTIWSWSSNMTSQNSTTLKLSDDGNLVLSVANSDASGGTKVLWESFDYMSDTFIQGMRMGINTKTGERQVVTSWRSPNDPTPGNFTMGLDPDGSTQVFIWKNGTIPYWRSGEWNGASNFIGIPWRPLYSKGFDLHIEGNERYYTYTAANNSLQRFVLQWKGVETIYLYEQQQNVWEDFWDQPVKQCELYGACGPNGLCKNNGDLASCSCLDGFEPKSDKETKAGNWSGGCVRQVALDCQQNRSGDGYKTIPGMKLPDHAIRFQNIGDSDSCMSYCSNNCSCIAYAFVQTVGCMLWNGDLIDLYHFDVDGYDLFVKEPRSLLDSSHHVAIIAGTVSAALVFLLVACSFLWWKFIHRSKTKGSLNISRRSQQSSLGFLRSREDFSGPSQFADESEEGKKFELPLFTFDCLAIATNKFGSSNKLGEGGFGLVYKGMLPGGEEIAVKRLSATSGQGVEEFKNEVILIAKLQHRNLVRLLGCCIHGEERLLVYEYLPNKSLDAFLFDPSKRGLLDWKTRFNIIEGIARGLLYLHRDSRLRVVHRDLKASNILLDRDMEPKISDFGMARIFGGDQNQENTTRVVGTLGYMSPEYAMEGIFSVKSDVYSFGILLLEIITGERNSSFHNKDDSLNIVGYAYKLWYEERASDLIDPTMKETCSIPEVLRCIQVALLCVQDLAYDRPEIPLVIKMITNDNPSMPVPRRPTFTLQGYSSETSAMKSSDELMTACDVTITRLQGR
ncbi:Serine/threonine-protein kinase [Rhynchospora pubera]|uniref:Receptor-like serine/threonine-protein kinase n=1 Tax=Rhynchospora pubera TaxID=906938 RepID=A0AAV8BS18_9POAL|nr:Serine/threonine-protein kinase [Rhynchospora pubera]